MNGTALKNEALPSLLSGSGRQPFAAGLTMDGLSPANSEGALKLLSLTAQALRFERPPMPASFSIETAPNDTRPIVPAGLRRPIVRLLAGKTSTEHPAIAIARTFDRLRWRPHPFDLPALDTFVRVYAEQLGATALAWANRQKADAPDSGYFDAETLDDTNWMQSPPGRRVRYIETQREQDPDRARASLEAAWAQQPPDVRLRLLQAMQTGLSESDQPFLESLDKDRAPRVRSFALRLLSRLGSSHENQALQDCMQRIRQTQAGLLKRRTVLALEIPATVKEEAAPAWIRALCAEVSISELAATLNLSETSLPEAAAKDRNMLLMLALMATADRRLDLLEATVAHLENAWELLESSGLDDLGLMSVKERTQWVSILAKPYGRKLPERFFSWMWLHKMTAQAAPETLLKNVLETDWLSAVPGFDRHGQYWTEIIAALAPAPQRPALRQLLHTFDPTLTTTALQLVDILDAMEKSGTHV